MAIYYEVNLEIDPSVVTEFKTWLKNHVQDVLKCDGFERAEVFEVESNSPQLKVLYRVKTREFLEIYFQKTANRLREDGLQRFPGKFKATRRILSQITL